MDLEYLKLMNNSTASTMACVPALSHREELEIGVAIASELIDYVWDGKLSQSEIREELRQVVREIGIGHTDEHLAEVTVRRLRHTLEYQLD